MRPTEPNQSSVFKRTSIKTPPSEKESNNGLARYLRNRKKVVGSVSIHSPRLHDAEISEIDSKESSRMVSSVGKLEPLNTYGGTSKKLNEYQDIFSKVNGGSMASCLTNEYQRDFLTDLKLRQLNKPEVNFRISLSHFRRDNQAQKMR